MTSLRSLSTPVLIAALAWVGSQAVAQSQQATQSNQATASPPPPATPLPTPELIVPNSIQPDLVSPAAPANYIIGVNDLLSVFVYQMPEMTRQVRVSAAGTIRIPFATKQFPAVGQTSLELQEAISADLLAEGLVRQPVVQVTVVQVESKPIVVGGAVQRPVVLQAARPMRLLEVLSSAGGLSPLAGDTVLITSNAETGDANGSLGDRPVSHSYNLVQLIRNNSQADDPILDGNQLVTVMPARMIYVVGDFKQPGAFPLVMGEPITVLKAVALAKGFDLNPDKGKAEIIQTQPDGTQTETLIQIDKIVQHKLPDVALQAGDILYVSKDTRQQALLTALTDTTQLITLGVAYHFP